MGVVLLTIIIPDPSERYPDQVLQRHSGSLSDVLRENAQRTPDPFLEDTHLDRQK